MKFTQADLADRIEHADKLREPVTLTVEEEVVQEWIERLEQVRITKKTQQAIAEALGLDAGEIWS